MGFAVMLFLSRIASTWSKACARSPEEAYLAASIQTLLL